MDGLKITSFDVATKMLSVFSIATGSETETVNDESADKSSGRSRVVDDEETQQGREPIFILI